MAPPKKGKKLLSLPMVIHLCGLLCLGACMVEGSVSGWGSIFLHSNRNAGETTAALVFAYFSLSAVASRMCSARLRQQVSDQLLLAVGTLRAGVCLALVILCSSLLACLFLYALTGIFLAPAAPIVYSHAGSTPGIDPVNASSTAGLSGYSGMLFFPPPDRPCCQVHRS